ncbi:hypothetical protein [Burkholderia sp. L27(2015)]|uniref:hypothetical protein n=1 Tax=Burkholderia sp. L27(2015) TaxID=1641858 RepID=UPI00131E6464|nr:hypothetical protein [Burkholderia sp. L27(2015)]
MNHHIRNAKANGTGQLPRSDLRAAAIAIALYVGVGLLAGCTTAQVSDKSYATEFEGEFVVTDSSNDPSLQAQTVSLIAVSPTSLSFSVGGKLKYSLANCSSREDNWSNTLGNGGGQDRVHQLVCTDSQGWRWYLSHGAPGLVEQPALFNRVLPSFHTIQSASGYIFHRARPNDLPFDYALEPAAR